MLRSFFVQSSKAVWVQKFIFSWDVARRASRRFIAGETIEEAIKVVTQLNLRGINCTLDHLGENTSTEAEARGSAEEISVLLHSIHHNGLRSNVSVKLSQIGLSIDAGLCRELLGRIIDCARELDNFVRIDMEDSSLTGRTLAIYEWALGEGYAANIGIVLQANLYRTVQDLESVLVNGGRIRLCKGAYQEPADIAFPRKRDVDVNFDYLTLRLLKYAQSSNTAHIGSSGRTPPIPAIATHDPARIAYARRAVAELKVEKTALEFQMLYGIRRDLQERLKTDGFPVRVYIPYGTHWYPYFMRRLGERPANVWFFITNYFRH